jgi:hypothetical protein
MTVLTDFAKVTALADQFVSDLHAELQARWEAWPLDLEKQEVHEVVGALLARQVTLARELAQAPSTWNYHIGPIVLRAMADVYISLAWVLVNPVERARRFIHYGLGQEKLQLEHRKAELKDRTPGPEVRRMLEVTERWIDAQRYSFLTEVDVGSWSGASTRQMAEQCGCLDFYNYVYQPFSACAHSMWHHIGKYNVKRCENPLHRYHLVPDDPAYISDLHLLYLAGKYVEKAFRLFDQKTGVVVRLPSAFTRLETSMDELARAGPDAGEKTESNP